MVEYVGLDVSKEETSICVKDAKGKLLACGKALSDPDSLFEWLREHCICPELIVMETGTMSGWLTRGLRAKGLRVECIDAVRAHAVMKLKRNKTDANDADLLAELARTGFFEAVTVKSLPAHHVRSLLKARDQLVRQRKDLDNTLRGLLRSFGIKLARGRRFPERVAAAIADHPQFELFVMPLLSAREGCADALKRMDRQVRRLAGKSDICRLLMTAPGVGPVTSLCFSATIDDPKRFAKSRSVGAYVGMTAKRYQSGEMDYIGRISKQGDNMLRAYLFEAANAMMNLVKRDHPLREWAFRLQDKSGSKKARVALARKLAVILHAMWMSGEAFRWPDAETTA
ncbi:MAG: IS110 family transposase [Filomicrobium sp.]